MGRIGRAYSESGEEKDIWHTSGKYGKKETTKITKV
jgi:hypothetical protein